MVDIEKRQRKTREKLSRWNYQPTSDLIKARVDISGFTASLRKIERRIIMGNVKLSTGRFFVTASLSVHMQFTLNFERSNSARKGKDNV